MKTAETIEAQASQKVTASTEGQNTPKKRDRAADTARIAPWKWKKGFCPNPGGRPKKDRSSEIAREIFENNPESVYKAMAKALLKGNAYAFSQLADRAYGKLKEIRELSGANGGPIEYRDTDESSINERIKRLETDLGLAREIDEAGRVGSAQARTGKTNGEAKDSELLPR